MAKKTFDPLTATVAQLYSWATARCKTPPPMPGQPDPAYEGLLRKYVTDEMASDAVKSANAPAMLHVMAARMLSVKLSPKSDPIYVEVRIIDQRLEGERKQVLVSPIMGRGECWIAESRLKSEE